jgi:cation diffusion facilitator CzcD-associated flavoprotein CzcO
VSPTGDRTNVDVIVDAVVVGAGFAGLYMLHRLRQLGLRTCGYEAGAGVGGTWYWNRYPGARCDSESVYYSYSFSAELQQEWEWSERYASQPEILRYLEHVADRFDLRPDIRFGTRVVAAAFDEEGSCWSVRTDTGEQVRARFLISAIGCLSTPNVPVLPGVGDFRGPVLHTGRWPHEPVDVAGRRVGVLGTGSSGVQTIPLLAEQAGHLTVFQRTANYSVPARNAPADPVTNAAVKADYDAIRERCRRSLGGFPFDVDPRSALSVSPAEQENLYRGLWDTGGMRFVFGGFADVLTDRAANDVAADFVRARIGEAVHDPVTAEALTPRDHPFGTRRPALDTRYYETYNRDDVTLVDLRRTPVMEVTEGGLRTTDAEYPLDVLVLATGFDAMTGSLLAMNIVGREGVELRQKWIDGPRNLLGLMSAGFPNLFTITGPLSPSVFSNMPTCIEQHVDWIAGCLDHLQRNGHALIEPTVEAEDGWVEHAARVAARTLLGAVDSWWTGANVPGKPRVVYPYVAGVGAYRTACDAVAASGYDGFELTPSAPVRRRPEGAPA